MSNITATELTNTKSLSINVAWNMLGQILPMLIALFCIPIFIKTIGVEKFGILTIIWSIIGYANLFDMGMGRALTQKISQCIGCGDYESIGSIIWSAIVIMLSFGLLGCILLILADIFILPTFLKTTHNLLQETQRTIFVLAIFLPVNIINIGIKGIFDSFQKFQFTSLFNIFISICNFVLPLFIFPYTKNMIFIISFLLIGRLITLIFYFSYLSKLVKDLFENICIKIEHIKSLTNFGAWITISNIVGPVMVYFDRFFIVGMLSASIIAFYTTPFELAFRFFIIPVSIFSVLFPAYAQTVNSNFEEAKSLYNKSFWHIFFIMFIILFVMAIFAKQGLSLWINPDFAEKSYRITQIILLGVFLFSITTPAFNFIQALGRSDISAIIHLIELPIYLTALFFFIKQFDIIGAAIAWTLRGGIDFILFTYFLKRLSNKREIQNV